MNTRFWLTLLLFVCTNSLLSQNFEVKNDNGVKIRYSVISSTECEVINNNPKYSGEIVIPSQVNYDGKIYNITRIKDFAFSFCKNLKSVSIPESINEIGREAFRYCNELQTINIPNKVTVIKTGTFLGCEKLENIIVGNSVEIIEDSAFYSCKSLNSITISKSVKQIDDNFMDCNNLSSIIVDVENENYVSIDDVLFNKEITTLVKYPAQKSGHYTIPITVKDIREYAFYYCSNLNSIQIPNNVINIEEAAFEWSGLESVSIPKSVNRIGTASFNLCRKLQEINVENDNPYYSSINGVLFNKDKTVLLAFPGGRKGDYSIPNSVNRIEELAFCCNPYITNIDITNNVVEICYKSFVASGITSVHIGDGVEIIKENAFHSCYNLCNVEFGKSVKTIENGAFVLCEKLVEAVLPNSLISLGDRAFFNCKNLSKVVFGDSLQSIGNESFGYTNINSVSLSSSVNSIGYGAFSGCTNLSTVDLSSSLNTINNSTFSGCKSLKNIKIGENLTSIGESAFQNCI